MGRDETGQQCEDSLHSCREEPGQNEPQQKDRKSLPEGGKKSLGWHRCCLMPDGCWGSGKGLPAAALLGFAPQQVPVGDTGLEVALRNKRQKTEHVYRPIQYTCLDRLSSQTASPCSKKHVLLNRVHPPRLLCSPDGCSGNSRSCRRPKARPAGPAAARQPFKGFINWQPKVNKEDAACFN